MLQDARDRRLQKLQRSHRLGPRRQQDDRRGGEALAARRHVRGAEPHKGELRLKNFGVSSSKTQAHHLSQSGAPLQLTPCQVQYSRSQISASCQTFVLISDVKLASLAGQHLLLLAMHLVETAESWRADPTGRSYSMLDGILTGTAG